MGSMPSDQARHPLTVAIERRIDPADAARAVEWMHAGIQLAEGFDGFLGSGWVRPEEGSDVWYMLYRFRDLETLERWENSPQRADWVRSGEDFAKAVRVERRTGIEGWFDADAAASVDPRKTDGSPRTAAVQRPIPAAPPRWKQAITIWCGFFPTSLLIGWLLTLSPLTADLALPLRVLLTTLVMTPVMTYAVLPWVTRALRPWLQR